MAELTETGDDTGADLEPLFYLRPSPVEYPRLLPDLEPIGGEIRVEPEDFQVQEIPLYAFSGTGEHCYVTIVKTNRTTLQARQHLSRVLGVNEEDIGFAGFKDRRAVTQQTFSVPATVERVERIENHWLRIVDVTRHCNKLRTGHLAGNRFTIRIRGVREGALEAVGRVLEIIRETGLPNFFGQQRFGYFGDSYRIGCALLHRDPKSAIDSILAPRPGRRDAYRVYYEQGKYQSALGVLPPGRRTEAAILHSLRRYPGNSRAAARRIPHQMKRMFFSAYQSFLFNWCLRERMEWGRDSFATLLPGDLAFIHGRGASFMVEDIEEARERGATGEISPSGPVFGRRMIEAGGREGRMEAAVLEAEKMRPQSFLSHVRGLKLNGSRRPYRIPLADVDVTEEIEGRNLVLSFTLPPGCYATMLLMQFMGSDLEEDGTSPPEEEPVSET